MFFKEMQQEFQNLFRLKSLRGVLLVSRTGEIIDSWLNDKELRSDMEALNLIQAIQLMTPSILSLPDVNFKRILFQRDDGFLLFSNVANLAFLVCFLTRDFNYITATVETDRTAYKIGKYLLNEEVKTKELNKFLRISLTESSSLVRNSLSTLRGDAEKS